MNDINHQYKKCFRMWLVQVIYLSFSHVWLIKNKHSSGRVSFEECVELLKVLISSDK